MPTAAEVLRAGGIVADPELVIRAAREAGLPLEAMAPKLKRESYGGRNVIGHDRVPTGGAYRMGGDAGDRRVTEAYLRYRGPAGQHRGRQQGWGPSQLTWAELQDQAEREGGLHDPLANMRVGARELARCLRAGGGSWREAGARYNGGRAYASSSTAAKEYGRWLEAAVADWQRSLARTGGAAPAPASGAAVLARLGDRDHAGARRWQQWLHDNFAAYAGDLVVDGDYGPATQRATAEFQQRAGVTGPDADGSIVGPRTLAAAHRLGFPG